MTQLSCPICSCALSNNASVHSTFAIYNDNVTKENDRHVNACLDNSSAPDSSEKTVSEDKEERRRHQQASWSTLFARMKTTVGKTFGYGFHSESSETSSSSITTTTTTTVKTSELKHATTTSKVVIKDGASKRIKLDHNENKTVNDGTITAKPKRPCPFYKKMPGTKFAVDAFDYGAVPGISAYFLSHFHADHYKGLNGKFVYGPIYCSEITAKLVRQELRVKENIIRILPLNKWTVVDGVYVYLMDANHCPGAVVFVFDIPASPPIRPSPTRIVHTGDFRAHPIHVSTMTSLQNEFLYLNKVDLVYLDTTYCSPKYHFPNQDDVVKAVAALCQKCVVHGFDSLRQVTIHAFLSKSPSKNIDGNKTLFLCGTYLIGKERVFVEIAKRLKCKIYADKRKHKIFACYNDAFLSSTLTSDPLSTPLHVVRMGDLNIPNLLEYLDKYKSHFSNIIAFRPTGWTFSATTSKFPHSNSFLPLPDDACIPFTTSSVSKCGKVMVYGVPYSEHSSVEELEAFIRGIKPGRIVPTVNVGSEKERKAMESLYSPWLK